MIDLQRELCPAILNRGTRQEPVPCWECSSNSYQDYFTEFPHHAFMTMYYCLVTQDLIQIQIPLISGTLNHGVQSDCGAQSRNRHTVLDAWEVSHADAETEGAKTLRCLWWDPPAGTLALLCWDLTLTHVLAFCVAGCQLCCSQRCWRWRTLQVFALLKGGTQA